jgi:glycosyltransferase involved in cell wall biosynthesis
VRANEQRAVPRRLRIGMAAYGDIAHDSRVQREAEALAASGHDVVLACLPSRGPLRWSPEGIMILPLLPRVSRTLPGTPALSAGPHRAGGRQMALIGWLSGYIANLRAWGAQVARAVGRVDVWHLHDLTALSAISPYVSTRVPLVYDSHELFLDTGSPASLPRPARYLLQREESRRIRSVHTLITVNKELARVLTERYRPRRVMVVHNCPPKAGARPGPDRLRAATGIAADAPIILHHGSLTSGRGIEVLPDVMLQPGLERAHLVLLGFGSLAERMRALSRDGRYGGRIHVVDAVPRRELLDWITTADVGAIARPVTDLNFELSTPNKLFECMAAGVPVVASGGAMADIVEGPAGALGVMCDPDSSASIAAAIVSLLELSPAERAAMRARCLAAARERWNWEAESAKLVSLYDELAAGEPERPCRDQADHVGPRRSVEPVRRPR